MATAIQRATFLNTIAPIAVAQAKKHNNQIYASVCIAQAIHESGWGTSAKMIRANAVFGIKVGSSAARFGTAWKGKAYKTGTTEYYDGKNPTKIVDFFRAYDNLSDSTEDYYDMLCQCKRYKPALNQSSPQKCIEAIVKGGYATGPEYAKRIMEIIKGYNLTAYDIGEAPQTNPYKLSKKYVKMGDRGESVKWVQWELNRHGANLTVDGIFGNKTKLSVLLFQKQSNGKLVVDAIVGPKTIEALTA